MKEKTDELKEKIEKDYKDMMAVINSTSLPLFVEDTIEDMHILIKTLIAENKELKEEKEELKRENLEIRDWKYVIDSPIDLDKLKELDLIKIKGKEYISKSIYNELEKDKKALINNYSKILGEFIPKSKVEEIIEELRNDTCKIINRTYIPTISSKLFNNNREKYEPMLEARNILINALNKLQSLLGKE